MLRNSESKLFKRENCSFELIYYVNCNKQHFKGETIPSIKTKDEVEQKQQSVKESYFCTYYVRAHASNIKIHHHHQL